MSEAAKKHGAKKELRPTDEAIIAFATSPIANRKALAPTQITDMQSFLASYGGDIEYGDWHV